VRFISSRSGGREEPFDGAARREVGRALSALAAEAGPSAPLVVVAQGCGALLAELVLAEAQADEEADEADEAAEAAAEEEVGGEAAVEAAVEEGGEEGVEEMAARPAAPGSSSSLQRGGA